MSTLPPDPSIHTEIQPGSTVARPWLAAGHLRHQRQHAAPMDAMPKRPLPQGLIDFKDWRSAIGDDPPPDQDFFFRLEY
jgi:hypothetical protein